MLAYATKLLSFLFSTEQPDCGKEQRRGGPTKEPRRAPLVTATQPLS